MIDRVTVAGSLARPALLADFLKASLEVRSGCGFGARAGALRRKSGFSWQSTPEVVGRQAPVALWQSAKRPEPTPTRTFDERLSRPARRGRTVAVGKAVLLIRVGQWRLTH